MPAVTELYTAVIGSSSCHTWSRTCLRERYVKPAHLHCTSVTSRTWWTACVKQILLHGPGPCSWQTPRTSQTSYSESMILFYISKSSQGKPQNIKTASFFPTQTTGICFSLFFWILETNGDHLYRPVRVPLTDHNGWYGNHVPGLPARVLVTAGAMATQGNWGERGVKRWCVCRGVWGTILLQADRELVEGEELAWMQRVVHRAIQ